MSAVSLNTKVANRVFERLTDAANGPIYLVVALLVTYAILPLGIYTILDAGSEYAELAGIAAVAAAFVLIGAQLPIADKRARGHKPRIAIGLTTFNAIVWTLFSAFVLVVWITAERIPLIAALGGADSATIAVLRENFLKAREGWQASFVYINAILCGALIPYSIALMFMRRTPARWLAFAFFFVYCVSFMEKAFFLKAVLPLLYLVAQRRIRFFLVPRGSVRIPLRPTTILYPVIGILLLITVLSRPGSVDDADPQSFFSSSYVPQGPLGLLVWRSVAVPVVTAAEAVYVLHDQFDGRLLWGATSSLIANLSGMEHIEYERLVFAAQWGQNETGTGSSNSVFITEAYVNFGWAGVALFSIVVGGILRLFAQSRNEAFRSMWILFAFGAYASGLIGLLFSNGFILLIGAELIFKIDDTRSLSALRRQAGSLEWTVAK